jgi:hypothetical protein
VQIGVDVVHDSDFIRPASTPPERANTVRRLTPTASRERPRRVTLQRKAEARLKRGVDMIARKGGSWRSRMVARINIHQRAIAHAMDSWMHVCD